MERDETDVSRQYFLVYIQNRKVRDYSKAKLNIFSFSVCPDDERYHIYIYFFKNKKRNDHSRCVYIYVYTYMCVLWIIKYETLIDQNIEENKNFVYLNLKFWSHFNVLLDI
jgi:hypothetical protein